MRNIGQLMKQAQKMQSKMAEMQEQLGQVEISGQSGGGMVTAVMTGKSELRSLKIDPKLVDAEEVEMLEDLIVAAVNDAKKKVEVFVNDEMQKMTGGLSIPGMGNLPF
ncbi:YbaB/EbfC family nucleoid-associated protein [Tistrella bauzanensis]|jgi:DNA-binding YbaB/EbfC family protein|uniref:Nucleoid-associated protein WG926_17440 n=2 Tax=Tistrella TaxID=171436 RepID=A0ABU9YN31_9PROT|nr:YbaB/EbfC family nucleoid-associated protein [Tistrella bauzanensis]GGB57445.1 nucleoid-associated protein [Tistrella bauzanensis]